MQTCSVTTVPPPARKRRFDLLFSAAGLFVFAFPMSLIWCILRMDRSAPPIYRQERLGLGGKPFIMLKFRTMRPDAEITGVQITAVHDSRITLFGHFLRRFHLDELPQLINVLKGDMSLIGPRPERAFFYEQISKELPEFPRRLEVPQGLTGWAQIHGGYDLTAEEKLQYDLEYIRIQSLLLDLYCLFRTIIVVLNGKGSR